MDEKWNTPTEVTDIQMAFPADALEYMPTREEAETHLESLKADERGKWTEFQSKWFFNGLPETTTVNLKENVDGTMAFRHLQAIQGSFAPQHEHKMAAVAALASLWFSDVDYGE